MSSRPLMQNGIVSLEALYSSSLKDAKALEQLRDELSHRHVPRAVTLLLMVEKALDACDANVSESAIFDTDNADAPSATMATAQEQLRQLLQKRLRTTVPNNQPTLWLDEAVAVTSALGPISRAFANSSKQNYQPQPQPERGQPRTGISIEEACVFLKVTASAAWEDIEHSRRQIVQLSHPLQVLKMNALQRAMVNERARKANAACATLLCVRIPSMT